MDPITHAALATAAGMVAAGRETRVRHAALAGCVAGLLPDLDIFLMQPGDPLAMFRWHRHFTHSWAFLPVVAALGAAVAWGLLRRRRPAFRGLLGPAAAGAASHLLIDAGTSYGTMLWWPFSPTRVSWDCLPIIDPVFVTLPLLAAALVAFVRARRTFAWAGVVWMAAYAVIGLAQHTRVERALIAHATTEHGRAPERVLAMAAPLSPVLWRGVYEYENRIYAVAVRAGVPGVKLSKGGSLEKITPDDPAWRRADSPTRKTLGELAAFAHGWLTVTRSADGRVVVGDARFATLPDSIEPMWGVTWRADISGDAPVAYSQRGAKRPYRAFFGMLLDHPESSLREPSPES